VKKGPLRILGALVLTASCASIAANTAVAQVRFVSGKLTGVVRDTAGTPQMGASVEVIPEMGGGASHEFLTDMQGIFRGDRIATGLYTVRVTLAGFLPTLQQHVRINANLTTMLRIQMESMFASLGQLRRPPASGTSEKDDWKWVLRSASGMRPVLQWDPNDPNTIVSNDAAGRARPRMLVQFTDGARRPGSVSNMASAPGTAFAYDQGLGNAGRLLLAGQVSYEDAASGGVAAVWMPAGTLGAGPHTALVLREAKLGPEGLIFRGVRIDQGGAVTLGDRAVFRYGGEFVLVGLGSSASAVRPRLEMETKLNDQWRATMIFASQPAEPNAFDELPGDDQGALSAAIDALDSFPALMWREGRPVLQGGWHEEVSAKRKLGEHGKLQLAAFHDDNHHAAVFGRGNNLPTTDFFPDAFSNGFAYDGGGGSNWGGRVAVREKLANDLELTAIYAAGGALAPNEKFGGPLRNSLRMVTRQSVGANLSAKLPRLGTRVLAGYKWIDGTAVSRVDSYGESLYGMDPYLHVAVRQQLPKFAPGRWEAMADCENLLAQGYVSVSTKDGQMVLVPAFRSFRGGVSVQF